MYRQTLRRHVDRTLALELEDNPDLNTEERLKELELQYGLSTPEGGIVETRPAKCDWKFGYSDEKIAKCMAVIDIVKGTFGLILTAYISFVLFGLMTKFGPDFEDLKRRMSRTEFVYLLAYGHSGMGISVTVCGMALWYFFLISFGKVLFDAVNQRSIGKLRLWYAIEIIRNSLFVLLYIRLILAHIECQDRMCRKPHNFYVWLVAEIYYLFSFLPSIYSITIVHSLISDIRSQQLKELRYFRQSRSQSQNNTLTRPTSRGSYYRHGQNAHSPVLSPVSSAAMITATPHTPLPHVNTSSTLNNYVPTAIPVAIPIVLPPVRLPSVPKYNGMPVTGFNL